MDRNEQKIYLLRHGETEWSLNGRHTGVTDVPLTDNGRMAARRLQPVLARENFELVLTSPLQRARETCELAGLSTRATVELDLMEWNYGEYEGLTTQQIRQTRPAWTVFRDGCPGGESPEQIGARADRVLTKVRATEGNVALFAHGHILRVLAVRWIDLPARYGEHFLLDTATLNVLGHFRDEPVFKIWNAPLFRSNSQNAN
ncbi:MAG TPA: histidine phosphatase family protein [Candidatus Binatia bacterium]|nr:histidine phosphatase family protein [Candidatus Binatia bacterium]